MGFISELAKELTKAIAKPTTIFDENYQGHNIKVVEALGNGINVETMIYVDGEKVAHSKEAGVIFLNPNPKSELIGIIKNGTHQGYKVKYRNINLGLANRCTLYFNDIEIKSVTRVF